jgi:hypothetical protein
MADSTAIAITSLIVTGVATVTAPAIAAWLQNTRERERAAHEERVADVRELRGLLDETAEALDRLNGQLRGPTGLLILQTPPWPGEDVAEALTPVWDTRDRVARLAARLAIRLGRDAAAVRALDDVQAVADDIGRLVGVSTTAGGWMSEAPDRLEPITQEDAFARIKRLHDSGTDAADRFVDEAQKIAAATLRDHA